MTAIDVPVKEFLEGITPQQHEVLRDFDSEKYRFFLINWHRRARKTTLAINLLIRDAATNPNSRYGYITSTYTAAKNIVWRDPNMLRRYLPEALVKRKNETELYVEFKNGSILSIHGSDNPDSLRGVDFKGVVIDEWAFVDHLVWEQIIRPIIAQDKKRWAVFIFTPRGRNHAYRQWVATKDNPEWGHYQLDAPTSGIIDLEELEKIRKEVPANTYAQEFLCEFGDDGAGVFHGVDLCATGGQEGPKLGLSYVTGVDLARIEDYTVLTTMCRESRHVVSHKRFNDVDWSVQKEAIIDEVKRYNSMAVIDSTGVGDPIFEDLNKAGISARSFKITNPNKKELIDRLAVAIEQRLITFPVIIELVDELKTFTYELTNARNIRYAAPSGMHDDCLKEGTLIKTDKGYMPIEDIKVGDLVLTHKGRYKKVEKTIKKTFDGDFYSFRSKGINLDVSYNHPVYAASRSYLGNKSGDFIKRQWVLPCDWKKSYRVVSIKQDLKTVRSVISDSEYYVNEKQSKRIKLREISVDKDFCYLLGLFLADGNCSNSGIYCMSIAFNSNHKKEIASLQRYLKKLGVANRIESNSINGCAVIFSSKLLWNIFKECYDKNKEKICPRFIWELGHNLKYVLNGWSVGDGWNTRGHRKIATTSYRLCLEMRDIAVALGKYATILKLKRNRYGVKNKDQFWLTVHDNFLYSGRWRKTSKFEYAASPKVNKYRYKGDVWNLQVADDKSFIANGVVVHNCVISLALAVWGCRNFLYGKKIDGRQDRARRRLSARQPMNAGFGF